MRRVAHPSSTLGSYLLKAAVNGALQTPGSNQVLSKLLKISHIHSLHVANGEVHLSELSESCI